MINARAIWVMVRQVRSASPLEDWHPDRAAIMFEPFESIHWRVFPPINFLSKLEWNLWGRRPAYALNNSRADVIDVDDKDDIPYNQQYIVAESTSNNVQRCPPNAMQPPKTMSIWTLSRNCLRFLIGLTFARFSIVAKEPMVDGSRPDFTKLAFVAAVR